MSQTSLLSWAKTARRQALRQSLLIAYLVGLVAGAHAQGTVSFNNTAASTIKIDNVNATSAQGAKVELLWAPVGTTDLNLFQPVGAAASVGTVTPGRFIGGNRTIPGIPPGGIAQIVVRGFVGVDYASAAVRMVSPILSIDTGDPTTTPAGTATQLSVSGFAGLNLTLGGDSRIYLTSQTGDIVTNSGVPVTMSITIYNPTSYELGFQWYFNGTPIPFATNADFHLPSVSYTNAGNYHALVLTNQQPALTSTNSMLQVLANSNAPSIRINGRPAVGTVPSTSPAMVSIEGGFPGGFNFYTLDGSTPTTSSSLYNGPFALTLNATIRAMSLSADFTQTSDAPAVGLLILPSYAVSVSVVGNGSISLNPASGPYISNSVVSVTAVANVNWIFANWSGDLSGSVNPASITMNGPRSLQAVFVPTAYPLTVTVPGGGSRTANGQNISPNTYYPTGSVVVLEATPESGWSFLRWQGTTNSTANPLNISMTQTQIVEAIFGTVVSTNIAGSGSVVMSATNPVAYGTILTNTAIPAPGYYLVAWSGAVSGTNNPVTFTVTSATSAVGALFAASPAPTIVSAPTNTSVIFGSSATFDVQASGAAPLTYQWRKWGVNIVGATSTNYTIGVTLAGDAGNYDVVVTNGFGSSVTSAVVTLTILFPPTIVTPPQNRVVINGSNTSFTVTAGGTPPLSYQWLKNGANIGGATATNYNLTAVTTNDQAGYSLAVTSPFGAITSAVGQLTVVFPPSLLSQPTNQIVASGTSVGFGVTATGTEPLSYQWQLDGTNILDATNTVFTINSTLTNDAGNYLVIVSNPYGQLTSAVATLTVFIPANISSGPFSQLVSAGETATFTVGAFGYPALNYQWRFNGVDVPGAIASSLAITNVATNNLGYYWVEVWNAYSSATSSAAQLLMLPGLRVPYGGGTAIWGKDATLGVSAWGSGDLSYQWFKDGQPVSGATNQNFVIPAVQISDGGLYSVVVSSPYGSVTNMPAQLVINPANIALGLYAGIIIEGVPGYTYGIEYSTNLTDTNSWQSLTNVTLLQPVEIWMDKSVNVHAPGVEKRFYRVTSQ